MKRLSEAEGDHELHSVLKRLRVYHPPFGRRSTGCTSQTKPARRSSRSGEGRDGSQEDIWTEYYDEAMGILAMGLQ